MFGAGGTNQETAIVLVNRRKGNQHAWASWHRVISREALGDSLVGRNLFVSSVLQSDCCRIAAAYRAFLSVPEAADLRFFFPETATRVPRYCLVASIGGGICPATPWTITFCAVGRYLD